MPTIKDKRANPNPDADFVVFIDTFMSGWGGAAGGRSLCALEVTPNNVHIVWANGCDRSEMKRPRHVKGLAALKRLARGSDHLSIVDRTLAARWYEPKAFAPGC